MSAEVLIVGAGPTGLTLALALEKAGVRFRIVDKAGARSDESKALGMQAGALEALEAYFGEALVARMVEAGNPARKSTMHVGGHSGIDIDLSFLPSKYNYVLILAQSETERILGEALATPVERQRELVAVEERGGHVHARLRTASGETEEVVSDYLVGCDGAHSAVRRLLEIPFEGAQYTGDFVLADARLEWPWDYGGTRTFAQREGVLVCLPMRGERRYRLIMLKGCAPATREEPTLDEVCATTALLSRGTVKVDDVTWLTRFRVHHRVTDRMREGRCFLAGDAAHIHSPVGGQGMNLGMQDALNLGYRLTKVLRAGAPDAFLDDYERVRLPLARRVIKRTDAFSRTALQSNRFVLGLRQLVAPHLFRWEGLQRRIVGGMSQLADARAEIQSRRA